MINFRKKSHISQVHDWGMMKRFVLPLSVAALLLAGCSSGDAGGIEPSPSATAASPSASPSAPETPAASIEGDSAGAYTFETEEGVTGTLDLPGEAPADLEEWRISAGGGEVTYLTGTLDNRNGSDSFDVFTVTVYDMDGNEYTYEPADDYLGTLPPEDTSAAVYNPYIELQNAYSTVVSAGASQEFVMAGPALPEQIAGVSVSNGFMDYGAMPAG